VFFFAYRFLGASEIRPITLVVMDNETGLPIPNIIVNYRFQTSLPRLFVDVRYITIEIDRLITDNNGEVIISARSYFLRRNEEFSSKSFYINIGRSNNRKLSSRDFDSIYRFFTAKMFNREIIGRTDDSIGLINDGYYATAVHVFNNKDWRENPRLTTPWFWYHFEAPIVDDEELRITVMLARNKS
jgi:hypothetical protein